MFPPYFYFQFSRNRLLFAWWVANLDSATWACSCVLLDPTDFAFRPISAARDSDHAECYIIVKRVFLPE